MNRESSTSFDSAQEHYWKEFQRLKYCACYTRRYRDHLAWWETRIAIVRAITSSSSIAGWVIWRQIAFVWALLIAATQVVDALQNVLPFQKRRESLSGWCNELDLIFVMSQRDWEATYAGRMTEERIVELTHQLRLDMQHLEMKFMPQGLPPVQKLVIVAELDMVLFFEARYSFK
ncbi:hypothetical protein [Acidicapsa ligni]|uniref:hypothetical protein n=1 Tax=Acidicapsa ligni TaxID=542300 RepID=UPI0021DFF788|nr:hypothetical protein [Acidicapsa ligni]